MRPQTGEILAMANRPNFDLNLALRREAGTNEESRMIDMMEPGSTFKIVAAAAALNEHKVRPDTTIFCENGLWNSGGRALHDHRPLRGFECAGHSREIEQHRRGQACARVGDQKFYEYIRRFGFGDRTGIELPGRNRWT